jgi:TolB-like protein/tetratricopeptide (TPR) repeat protein
MSLQPGTRLGPYEITGSLGAGGMGEVFRARDTRLDRDIAIKTLSVRLGGDVDRLARFEREARAASSLNHPNILHVYDVGTEAGVPYIAMELVEGETLRSWMVKGIETATAVRWMSQVAEALGKAHSAGIVHRDLKPENIMVSRDGYVKVLDFGLAKLAEGDDSNAETRVGGSRPGVILGTVGYMSPEQAQAGTVDRRSDVFSFGCVLHEVLGGRPAFTGASDIDRLHRIVYGEPAPLPATIASGLRQIVERCLYKEPRRRYGSMTEIVEELKAAAAGDDVVAASPEASRSIAVLPFDDLSAAKDSEYLGAGVAEEIITDLSAIDAMRVVARASAAAAKGTGQSVPAIAGVLGVQYVVTGSVRRAGDRLRIAAQLVDASRDVTLWAQKFDGTMDDIFDIQEAVARAIAAQLRLEISSGESGRLRRRPVANVRAHECCLRARNHTYKFTPAALDEAKQEIDRAIDLEGPNALLYATKGLIEWQYFNIGAVNDRAALDRAEALARRSLALDPASAKAETVLGLVAVHRGDLPAAVRHLEHALARDPSDTDAAGWLLVTHTMRGRNELAGVLADRLAVLDPIAPFTMIGTMLLMYMEGRFEESLEQLERLPEKGPFESGFRVQLLILLRRFVEAAALSDALLQSAGDDPFVRMAGMLRFAREGNRPRVEALLSDTLRAAARNDLQYSIVVSEAFALLGDVEQAVEWFRHAMSRGYLAYPFIATHDWLFDRVRSAPAFQAALDDMRAGWLTAGRAADARG